MFIFFISFANAEIYLHFPRNELLYFLKDELLSSILSITGMTV